MKKIGMLLFTFLLTVTLAGCGAKDEVAPVFGPFVNISIEYDADFDPVNGISVTDDIDGDVSSNVDCTIYDSSGDEGFDVRVTDVYSQVCTVSDAAGNLTTAERTITVLDEVIGAEISGVSDMVVGWNKYFDPMTGLLITDKKDGIITEDVVVTVFVADSMEQVSFVDTTILRSYIVNYSIRNSLDVITEMDIQVDIIDDEGPVILVNDFTLDNYHIHNLLDGVTAMDAYEGEIDDITYTLYDTEYNEVEYDSSLYGDFIVAYQAEDSVGNVTITEVDFELVDVFLPEIVIDTYHMVVMPEDMIDLGSVVTVHDVTDEELDITYIIRDFSTDLNVTNLTNSDYGFYQVTVSATDGYGNKELAAFYLTITTGNTESVEEYDLSARTKLEAFYEDAYRTFYSNKEVCEMHVGHINSGEFGYDYCMANLKHIKNSTSNTIVQSTISYTDSGIKYFTNEVTYWRPIENVTRTITYHFEKYEYSEYVYIVFDSDPFNITYEVHDRTPEFLMIDNEMLSFYNVLFINENIDIVTACQNLVVGRGYSTMELDECIEYLEIEKALITDVSIGFYGTKTVKILNEYYDGYEIEVTLEKEGFTQTVFVDVAFFTQGGVEVINFSNGFFGPDYVEHIKIVNDPPTGIEAEIEEFYDAFLDDSITPIDFCNEHILINPFYEYNLDGCVDYVEHIRSFDVGYTIQFITPTTAYGLDGIFDAYFLDVIFDDGTGNGTHSPSLNFVILEIDNEYYPVFFEPEMFGFSYEQHLQFASLMSRYYEPAIAEFYDDLLDGLMDNYDFFDKYYFTEGLGNDPLSYSEVADMRTDVLKTHEYVVNSTTFSNTGSPVVFPTYTANITRSTSHTYDTDFYFYYNIFGELVFRVNFNSALGGGFE